MADELFPIETAATGVEFVGFESASAIGPAPPKAKQRERAASASAKPRRGRGKPDRRVAIRVWFDARELARVTGRAAAQGVPLREYLRRRALRDPRIRQAPAAARDDLFARAEITQTTTVRLSAPLSPELEQRIAAYFAPRDRLLAEPPREPPLLAALPPRSHVLARLGQFLTVLMAGRWHGQRAAPPAGT